MVIWYYFRKDLGIWLNLPFPAEDAPNVIGFQFFLTNNFLVFYWYYGVMAGIWAAFWYFFAPHKWQNWSVLGSALIIFLTFVNVQTFVGLNYWVGDLYNNIQVSLTPNAENKPVAADYFNSIRTFWEMAIVFVIVAVFNHFFVQHYIFRWREAMNNFYVAKWDKIRNIEGASQRIQEDTMRFASIMQSLGVNIIESVMTIFAFLPLLYALSANIESIPFLGNIPAPLVTVSIAWAIFGTLLMIIAGIKLPGLEFMNQRVEAAYRKELVYGEDDVERAQSGTLNTLFKDVRKNYFRIFGHYVYFNLFRNLYLNADNVFTLLILLPTIVAGAITFGIYQQISRAFSQISDSFQFLIKSWPTIIDLLSVYKRLKSFQAAIDNEDLPQIDQE